MTPKSKLGLNGLPGPALVNLLADDHLHIGVSLRLGAELCVGYTCRCGSKVDVGGYHGPLVAFRKAGLLVTVF